MYKVIVMWNNYSQNPMEPIAVEKLLGYTHKQPICGEDFILKMSNYEIEFGKVSRVDFVKDLILFSTNMGNYDLKIIHSDRQPEEAKTISLYEFKKMKKFQEAGVLVLRNYKDASAKPPRREQIEHLKTLTKKMGNESKVKVYLRLVKEETK